MAGPAPPRNTTISTQIGGRNVIRAARAVTASLLRPTFTTDHMSNGSLVARMLNDLVSWVEHVTGPATSSPLLNAMILKNIALTAATVTNVPHLLGRAPQGWFCVRAQTAAFSAFETSLPTGLKADKYLALRSNNTGTYDLVVF